MDGIDIYFVSNKTNEAVTETVEFRATNKHVEYWDPVTAKQFRIPNVQSSNGKSKVSLQLPGYGSEFIVFTREDRELGAYGQASKTQTTELKSPWKLSFPENWGAPSSVELDELISWTDHEDKGIRYFSGTATYENKFTVSKDVIDSRKTIRMDLGEVYDVAEVLVNGKSAGVLWTKPYQMDIQDLVKQGENKLEVKITNLWINRLTGDIGLPENEKFCRTNVPPVTDPDTGHGDLTWRIQTSGLLGPVTVSVVEE